VNFFLLRGERFSSPYWLTFRQALERGGHVRKGEKGTSVFFWKVYDRAEQDSDAGPDSEQTSRRFVARYYTVFNVEQCDGLEYPSRVLNKGGFVEDLPLSVIAVGWIAAPAESQWPARGRPAAQLTLGST
jgi:antirestriction protein ArdC